MYDFSLIILLAALILDWYFGEPDFLWSNVPHPVVMFGKAVSFIDSRFNLPEDSDELRYMKGALAMAALIILAAVSGYLLDRFLGLLGYFGVLLETFMVFTLLAQKSLYDHVKAVADGLQERGIDGGREAVSMIVGRDAKMLDQAGVGRAAIESLAENFSDGVVAPALWYAVFGLPGLFAYKIINTADSMIGYKNERYLWFGRFAAQADDLANWLPARVSVLFLSAGAGLLRGVNSFWMALTCSFRDSGLHRSPNAGWPEAAMAGGAGLALGGPRRYSDETVQQTFINSAGKREITFKDINLSLQVFARACFSLWAAILVLILLL